MFQPYLDLLLEHADPPLWYDEAGCPRWVEFSHELTNNIYADRVVLIEQTCQSCTRTFKVVRSQDQIKRVVHDHKDWLNRPENALCHKDPPCFGVKDGKLDQCSGSTMTARTEKILEFWIREGIDWKRVPELEGITSG